MLLVAFLPVLLAVLGTLWGLSQVILMRHAAWTAADLGALAGAQCLDLDRLARGELYLLADQARAHAEAYVRGNLAAGGVAGWEEAEVQVAVLNPDEGDGRDPVTGRRHPHATVCVRVSFPIRVRLGPVRWEIAVTAHAAASVVPR